MKQGQYDHLGVMLDMSRNSVMNIESLKKFMLLLKKMGYNCVMLYTEDTYEVDGEPYFGYMRGRYTKEELREIDAFGQYLGIEVIPCIQTLAHLNAPIRWGTFPVDTGDILLVGDERSYELIDHMFKTLSECIASRKIHVGMDEAMMLGRGRYLNEHGYENISSIMKKHLQRILEIAAKYGYELLAWSDMFFRSWCDGDYEAEKTVVPREALESCPNGVVPVYWAYHYVEEEPYSNMMFNHRQFTEDYWFAGSVYTHFGFVPHNDLALKTMLPALRAAEENGTKNILVTLWGDQGGECSRWSVLPSLLYVAEYAKGNRDEAKIKARFKKLFGIEYDVFMTIDQLDNVTGNDAEAIVPLNPSRYMLLSDTFNGIFDYTVKEGVGEAYYTDLAVKLELIAKKTRCYHAIFDAAAKLCRVLAVKYDLGVRVRAAYRSDDRVTLRQIAEKDYPAAIQAVNIYLKAFEKQWMAENKPQGFDVQHIRIGGVKTRLEYCRRTLLSYLNGKLDTINELDEDILPIGTGQPGESIKYWGVASIMTASNL